jgi:hypothetical protein
MDISSLGPHCLCAGRPLLAALISLLTAAVAVAQERGPTGGVRYTLDTSTLRSLSDNTEQSRVEVVRWSSMGDSAWGMSLGASRDGNNPLRPGLGVRWRARIDDHQRLDFSAWRHLDNGSGVPATPDAEQEDISTRIELQFTSPRRAAALGESGALGVQLSSSSKLSMRMRGGKPMVYYRMQF